MISGSGWICSNLKRFVEFIFCVSSQMIMIIYSNRWWFHFQDASFTVECSCTSPNKTSQRYTRRRSKHTTMVVLFTCLDIWWCDVPNWQFKEGEKKASEIMSAWAKYTHPSLIMCERYFSCWFFLLRDLIIHTPNLSELAMVACVHAHIL